MTNTTTIIIITIAIIGWSLYFYMLWINHRAPRAPKVSDDAVKVSVLIFRDFTRLFQGACQQAKEEMSEQYDIGSGLSWEMEYNPFSRSFIILHGENEKLKWEIFLCLGHMVRTQTGVKTLISVA